MARGAESSSSAAKRAKVDKEDPLVRRRNELILEVANARVAMKEQGNKALREATESLMQDLRGACTDLEAANCNELLDKLPEEVWEKIVKIIDDENEYVQQNDMVALASTCRFFREKQKDLGRMLWTYMTRYSTSHSFAWYRWVCDTFEILPGFEWDDEQRVEDAVYEGDLVNCAALQGSVEILRWLLEEKGWNTNEDTGWLAGMGGSVEVLEYLNFMGYEFDEGACAGAVEGGHLVALKHLRGQDPPWLWNPPCRWDVITCSNAAREGHLDILKWARSQDPPCPWTEQTCAYAAKGGHLEVLMWVRAQDPPCPWDEETCANAARAGHVEVLEWARDQNPPCPWNEDTCASAVAGGHLDVLEWVRAQNPPCPWNEDTCAKAANGGHLDVLKWVRSQNPPCPWEEWTCTWAAGGGHLDVLQWVREQGLPCLWNVGTCEQAAAGGHLEVLQWLRAQDPPCPWDGWACSAAAAGGHLDVLNWARSQDPPCTWSRRECIENASEYGQQHVVDWIDQQEDGSDVHDEHFELRYFEDFRMT